MPVASVLAGSSGAGTGDNEADNSIICDLEDTCKIPYQKLSNQSVDPFLFGGRLMDRNHPQYRKYRRAIGKYPDVQSCLNQNNNGTKPDLLNFNWKRMNGQAETEVCLFRIMKSIKMVSAIQDWLRHYDFQVGELYQRFSPKFVPHFASQPVAQIQADWKTKQYRELRPSLIARIFKIETIHGYSVIVQFSQNGEIVGISAMANTK